MGEEEIPFSTERSHSPSPRLEEKSASLEDEALIFFSMGEKKKKKRALY